MPLETQPGRRSPRQQFSVLQDLRHLVLALLSIPQWMLRVAKRQFRLRTLLIFVFFVAIGGAWISYQRSLLEKQAAIAAELEQRGCIVELVDADEVDSNFSEVCSWRSLLNLKSATRIRSIMIPRVCGLRDCELVQQVLELEELCFKIESDADKLLPYYSARGWKLGKLVCTDPPVDCHYVLHHWLY